MPPVRLSILIPVYNEANSIRSVLERVVTAPAAYFAAKQIAVHLIVVDDGSRDESCREVEAFCAAHPEVSLDLIRQSPNAGKGAAIRTAIPHTTGDFVIIQDADLEYDPADYVIILKPLLDGRADVVYGSRFKGVGRAFLFWHYVGNKLLTFITNILYDTILTDMETCYKAFKGDLIRSIPLRSNRFDFEPEVTAKVLKRGVKLFEVPINYDGRNFEEGKKITWRDGVVALVCLIRYRFMD